VVVRRPEAEVYAEPPGDLVVLRRQVPQLRAELS
jgi:hypothetical protein